jgi:hypothetical protein
VPLRAYKTIKAFSQSLLLKVDFVDCYGRNVGLSYAEILARIKEEFPKARTTKGALRYVLYSIDRETRLPSRHRSRKILAREFARSLLIYKDAQGMGLPLRIISNRTKRRFPDVPRISVRMLTNLGNALDREGLIVPERIA